MAPGRHGARMTTAPRKPVTSPATLAGVGRSSGSAAMASATVNSGVVALDTPARPDVSQLVGR